MVNCLDNIDVDELIYYALNQSNTLKCELNTSFWQKSSSIDQTDFMVSITISQLECKWFSFLETIPSPKGWSNKTLSVLSILSINFCIYF